MNEYSDNFKGVRFPKDLWLDRKISLIEKSILVVIKNLDKGDDHCWASNNYLADFLQCSVPTITRAVGHLKEIGYVEEVGEGKTGVCRKLKLKIDISEYPNQNDETPNQNDYTPNQNDEGTLIKMIRGSNQNDEGVSSKGLPNSIYNNINNNIGEKNFCNADASPSYGECDVETGLCSSKKKTKRKTKKEQRYDEVMNSIEFNSILHHGIQDSEQITELDTLWGEYVELRCNKDYRSFTDGAVRRNMKVLEDTPFIERKTILEKSVTKGWTGLFPLNDYDRERIKGDLAKAEGSDEFLIQKIFDCSCREREDELPEGTTHNLLMDLCEEYGEERIKLLYYEKVKPSVDSRYSIKRDWIHN